MKNNFLIKKKIKIKKVQVIRNNFNIVSNKPIKKSINTIINQKKNNNLNTNNNKINDFTSKYNKIITSLNNKINNSEFINNENDLLKIYLEELNDFYNTYTKVH